MPGLVLVDNCRDTTATTGAATVFTLAGAPTGYVPVSAVGDGKQSSFSVRDRSAGNWVEFIGTYTASGNTLTVNTILASSNSGSTVTFTAGTKDVFCNYSASLAVYGGGGGAYPTTVPTLNLDFVNANQVDPRITFARASTATYYDGKTTAIAEQNLLTYSQDFSNAIWTKSGCTVTANSIVAPDGTTTAALISYSGGGGVCLIGQLTNIASGIYTISFYARNNTINYIQWNGGSVGTNYVNFDLSLGVVGTIGAAITSATITAVSGTSFYKIVLTTNNGPGWCRIIGIDAVNSGYYPNLTSSGTFYVWGVQIEQRSSVTAYNITTSAAITNYIPVLMTAPINVARLDYNPITGLPLGLLIEESRTNLIKYSSDHTNVAWTNTNIIISSTTIAPDGTNSMQLLVDNTTNGLHSVSQTNTLTAASYTYSVLAKAKDRSYIKLSLAISGTNGAVFNLATGAIGAIDSGFTATITPIGNNIYVCSITTTATAANWIAQCLLSTDGTTLSYAGNSYSGAYVWGEQLELGAFRTSYIPTTSTITTRPADSASMTGSNFSSWYNQSQGSFYCDNDYLVDSSIAANSRTIISIYSANSTYNILIYNGNGYPNSLYVLDNSIQQANITRGSASSSIKSACNISTSYQVAFNGVISSISTGTVPGSNIGLTLGSTKNNLNYLNGHIRKLAYYPVSLTSSNLVALTS